MTGSPRPGDTRTPDYLGRVLDRTGTAIATCFQLESGVIVTAFHGLETMGAADIGTQVKIDPLAGGPAFDGEVARTDRVHDLAVVTTTGSLPSSVPAVAATDRQTPNTAVIVTGVVEIHDPGYFYRYLSATGSWQGGTTRNESVRLGRIQSDSVMQGMSGGPVRRLADDVTVGVVSSRYNSADGWLQHTVWVARIEDLSELLSGLISLRTAASTESVTAADRRHLEKLLVIHERNVHILEEQEATYAGNAPVHLVTQLENERARLSDVRQRLSAGT